MHFVQALDAVPAMRGVLTLFEGVATGAADGYARIAGRPASVLLHLGPGLSNGLANLHNARRAHSPMVVVVGAHATGHARYDAPLHSDIEAARAHRLGLGAHRGHDPGPGRRRRPRHRRQRPRTAGRSPRWCCPPTCRGTGAASRPPPTRRSRRRPPVPAWSTWPPAVLRGGEPSVLLLGGTGLSERGLRGGQPDRGRHRRPAAGRDAPGAPGGRGRRARGAAPGLLPRAGRPAARRAGPPGAGRRAGRRCRSSPTPAGRPATWSPTARAVTELAGAGQDVAGALEELAAALGAPAAPVIARAEPPAGRVGRSASRTWASRSPRRCPSRPSSWTRPTPPPPGCRGRWPARRGTPCSR